MRMDIFPSSTASAASDGIDDAVSLVRVSGCEYGGLGLFRKDGDFYFPPNTFPGYVEPMSRSARDNAEPTVWFGGMFNENCLTLHIDQPALAPLHPNWIYGHFILEMLPKIVLLDKVVEPSVPMLISSVGPSWMMRILKGVIRRPMIEYDNRTTVVSAPEFLTVTNLSNDGGMRREMRTVYELLKSTVLLPRPPVAKRRGIYVSRRNASVDWHRIENEAEIEAVASAAGLEIVSPEQLSFVEQIELFDSAPVVVGEFSSAMHNAVFSRPGTRVLCLNRINHYQDQIADLMGHQIEYLAPSDGTYRDAESQQSGFQSMIFDAIAVAEKIDALI